MMIRRFEVALAGGVVLVAARPCRLVAEAVRRCAHEAVGGDLGDLGIADAEDVRQGGGIEARGAGGGLARVAGQVEDDWRVVLNHREAAAGTGSTTARSTVRAEEELQLTESHRAQVAVAVRVKHYLVVVLLSALAVE